jgi:hypothetical protein
VGRARWEAQMISKWKNLMIWINARHILLQIEGLG